MKKYLILTIFALLLTSCDPTRVGTKEDFLYPRYEQSSYEIQNNDELYNDLFNPKNKVEITLKFTNKALYNLQTYGFERNSRVDMYHPCNMILIINGKTYNFPEVGARMKGNTSRNNNFVNINGSFVRNDRHVNMKLSFNQTFDDPEDNDYYIKTWENKEERKERKNRTLGGQEKIDFKWNKNFDYTFTRSSYLSYAFQNENIPVQRNNIVKLNLKSETDSISFLIDLMEAIDGTFLKNHMPTEIAQGNLYKCSYPANYKLEGISKIGIETPTWKPVYDLKTNKKEPNHELLKNFLTVINNDTSKAEDFKETLENLIDVDEVLKCCALSWVVGNPDDFRNNYNNFFTYFRNDNNKLVLIPYDNDRCFGIRQDFPCKMEDLYYNSTKQDLANHKETMENPLLYRLFLDSSLGVGSKYKTIKEFENRYVKYCHDYAVKYLDAKKFKEFTEQFPWVEHDIEKVGRSSNITFREYAEKKLNVSPSSRSYVEYEY